MRKRIWLVVFAALPWMPAAHAAVGDAGRMFPPRLLEAQQKQWEAFAQQREKDVAQHDAKAASLAAQVEETKALLAGDVDSILRDLKALTEESLVWFDLRRTDIWQYLEGAKAELLRRSAEKEKAEQGVPPPLTQSPVVPRSAPSGVR